MSKGLLVLRIPLSFGSRIGARPSRHSTRWSSNIQVLSWLQGTACRVEVSHCPWFSRSYQGFQMSKSLLTFCLPWAQSRDPMKVPASGKDLTVGAMLMWLAMHLVVSCPDI